MMWFFMGHYLRKSQNFRSSAFGSCRSCTPCFAVDRSPCEVVEYALRSVERWRAAFIAFIGPLWLPVTSALVQAGIHTHLLGIEGGFIFVQKRLQY